MKIKYFDSHAHVNFIKDENEREQLAMRTLANQTGWIEIGTNLESSQKAVALAEGTTGVWASVGVHPDDIQELNDKTWHDITQLLTSEKVVAVGEIGLDFYRDGKLMEQLPVLDRFRNIAIQRNMPMIFHVRDSSQVVDGDGGTSAHEELLKYLESLQERQRPRGVIHTYSGNVQQAKRYLQLGLYLSFSGVITFKNGQDLCEVAEMVPDNKFLIETDAPFLTPEPFRGQQNEPSYVKYVVEKLAEVRGVSEDEVAVQACANAEKLYGIELV